MTTKNKAGIFMNLQLTKDITTPCIPEIFTINGKKAYAADFGNFKKTKLRKGGCKARLFERNNPTKDILYNYGITEKEHEKICSELESLLSLKNCTKCNRSKR